MGPDEHENCPGDEEDCGEAADHDAGYGAGGEAPWREVRQGRELEFTFNAGNPDFVGGGPFRVGDGECVHLLAVLGL